MTTANKPLVGFIGLGNMGAPMARNIARAGFSIAIFDKSDAAMAKLEDTSCRRATSPADAAREADIVVTMLPTTYHVRDVLFGNDGAAHAMRRGGLVVDMTTGDAAESDVVATDLRQLGLRHLDAPVGRTPRDAKAGTLLVMVGGDAADVAAAQPLFDAIADTTVHIGPAGTGIRMKLVNNYMAMVGMVLTGEALMFAAKLGLDRNTVVKVLSNTTAGRGQLLTNFPHKVLAGDLTPDFPLHMGYKDLNLALDLAASVGAPLGLGAYSRELYALAKSWGRADQDYTAMLLLLEDIANMKRDDAREKSR
jgi:4-hydroxybutyrate dehydrogenase/sulfolactaldehyde 3-reductase